ncbi:hypothetical protein [Arundinibacter roseus]|uniref:Uncharacterized protein n=1 Tax=Arundinibacter roseus TaxID=2070510 RepID=A0A4R4KGC0_9BACT|nr:hypothetical protein [Arundinibacter roseus]TDB67087.1 hypothetical protein EZE20_08210 [Arundinibacter roseus]
MPYSTKEPKSKWIKIGIGLVIIVLISNLLKNMTKATPEQLQEAALVQAAKASADSLATKLMDIRILSEMSIRKNLKDPESFELIDHEEYKITDPTPLAYYQTSIKYQAKNSFGALVIEKRCFDFAQDGALTKAFECE